MHLYQPVSPNGVLVVCDQRQKSDVALSHRESKPQVMSLNGVLKASFGKAYSGVTRLALYEFGQKPTQKQREEARREYRQFLADNAGKFRTCIVLPTPSQAMANDSTVKGTQVWRDLAPPDSLDEMRGTWWRSHGTMFCPVFAPLGVVGQVQLSFTKQWCGAALRLAESTAEILTCRPITSLSGFVDSTEMLNALATMHSKPLAIDIETIPNSNKITAIGIATNDCAVSVPFDDFEPACGSGREIALRDYPGGGQILRYLEARLESNVPKLFQNGTYDVPLLAARGLTCGGTLHDTLAMHAIAYPESRHALQLAAATQLLVPPWKSLFKPRSESHGAALNKDNPLYWYWDAKALRDYNAKDAFYTWHLGKALAWKVGVKL